MRALTKIRTAFVAAAILLVGLTGSAKPFDFAQGGPFDFAQGKQAPPLDFGPLEKVVADELRNSGTPGGAVAVVLGDRVVYSRGFGIANIETNEPVRPEMLFRLGSTTKMFTAAALVSLAERGAIDLNAPVGSYVTGLNAKVGRVTADQLLSHMSGFFDEAPMMGSHDETALEKEVRSWPAGSIFSNVNDLSRFVIAFLNDRRIDGEQVLSPAVIRRLSTPRAKIPGGDVSYGYGLQLSMSRGVEVVSHGGSRAGYGSSIRMVPSKKFGVIVAQD